MSPASAKYSSSSSPVSISVEVAIAASEADAGKKHDEVSLRENDAATKTSSVEIGAATAAFSKAHSAGSSQDASSPRGLMPTSTSHKSHNLSSFKRALSIFQALDAGEGNIVQGTNDGLGITGTGVDGSDVLEHRDSSSFLVDVIPASIDEFPETISESGASEENGREEGGHNA
jgi:hypothetical protein